MGERVLLVIDVDHVAPVEQQPLFAWRGRGETIADAGNRPRLDPVPETRVCRRPLQDQAERRGAGDGPDHRHRMRGGRVGRARADEEQQEDLGNRHGRRRRQTNAGQIVRYGRRHLHDVRSVPELSRYALRPDLDPPQGRGWGYQVPPRGRDCLERRGSGRRG